MTIQTSTIPQTTRQIQLVSRPHGAPTPANFEVAEVALPQLTDGQVLVHNTVMSVDPYMRGRMNDSESYIPPFQVGAPLDGGAVGTVIASKSDSVPVGTSVLHGLGWREHVVLADSAVQVVDTEVVSASAYLGILGMPGMTAYAGLFNVAEMVAGDTVFVSGAAGAVGSLVGQIAKLSGAKRVIGSAGSAAKVERLKELGFDAAFNYNDGSVTGQLAQAAPEGIDVYFDNVGGEHLEAAISAMKQDGRVAMCGAISQYNATEPSPAPRNLGQAIGKQLTLRGFIVGKYADQIRPEFQEKMTQWITTGQIQWDETSRDGLDSAPQAFIDMFSGANTGKMVVRL